MNYENKTIEKMKMKMKMKRLQQRTQKWILNENEFKKDYIT
jgi:hypothetical protein